MASSPSLSSLPGMNGFMVVTTELVTFTLPNPAGRTPAGFGHLCPVLIAVLEYNAFSLATLAYSHTGGNIPGFRIIRLFHLIPLLLLLILHLISGDT